MCIQNIAFLVSMSLHYSTSNAKRIWNVIFHHTLWARITYTPPPPISSPFSPSPSSPYHHISPPSSSSSSPYLTFHSRHISSPTAPHHISLSPPSFIPFSPSHIPSLSHIPFPSLSHHSPPPIPHIPSPAASKNKSSMTASDETRVSANR